MRYLYTGQAAKKIDEHAVGVVGMPSLILMERAALTAAKLLMERESADARFLAVCGTGNNGGDGVAVARILHEMGFKAAITIVGYPDSMTEETKKQVEIAVGSHVPVISMSALGDHEFDVMIDALFGVGLSRDITDVYEQIISDMNKSGACIYSLDIPSGIDARTGHVMGIAVNADVTITFGVNKLGLILFPGCEYAGEVIVADIGFPGESIRSVDTPFFYYEPSDIANRLPRRKKRSNKGDYGHVLVVAGSENMCGAAYFAAAASYRMGAGLVKVVSPSVNRDILLGRLPEILFCEEDELPEAVDWADSIVMGPGLGLSESAEQIAGYVIENSPVPTVIDGDGIRLCKGITSKLSENFILTPHLKEMSYITGQSVSEIADQQVSIAMETARELDCILAAKDARTAVTDGETCYINVSGNNGLSTGGTGDVLSGMIAGLLGQGMEPLEAACLGVYIHGLAAEVMSERLSTYSLMASDLLTGIPEVLAEGTKNGVH
ncbi:MAG: NAD(P)H-hydrate dehydratase [Eubacterium sp.]|nr:NAD(P)H-hydrate dehydratase [Eubacterium sp.]